jgi:hypothetical protein
MTHYGAPAVMEFDAGAVALLVGGAIAAIAFAVFFVGRWAVSFPDLPPAGPETSELRPEPPAIANLLVNRCKVTSAAAAATLLDLAARGHLELFGVGPDRTVVRVSRGRDASLGAYEQQVLALVRLKATGGSAPLEAIELEEPTAAKWRDEFAAHVVDDAKGRGLLRARWTRSDWIGFGVLAAVALLLLGLALAVADLNAPEPRSASSSSKHEDFGLWFVAVAGAVWFALMSLIHRLGSLRYSDVGLAAASHWLGVKRFLQHDQAFADTPPGGVAIWNRLLGYGAAVGTARAAVARIPLEEEDADVAWSRVGGAWHQVHVEYPTRCSAGDAPRAAIVQGLLRTVGFGALGFVLLPIVVDVVWNTGLDSVWGDINGRLVAVGLVFALLFGAVGVALVVAMAGGVLRLARGLADLGARDEVVGEVVKHHTTTRKRGNATVTLHWFAVDPGRVDEVTALRPGDDDQYPPRRSWVRVVLTPRLRHVISVDAIDRPADAGASPRASGT